jgi:kinesin family protein 6/9
LGGNCQTLLIANIRCEKQNLEETISTLRFATRMMTVTTTPKENIQDDPMALVKKYERIIKELKQELSMHDTLSNRSHIQYEPFTDSQRAELQKTLKAYLDGQEEEIEVHLYSDYDSRLLVYDKSKRSLVCLNQCTKR